MDYTTMTDADLLNEIVGYTLAEKTAKEAAEPLKKEMLRRQTESGEVTFEHDGWQSSLTKERFSETWLKRQYGYEAKDLPENAIKEKIVPEIDWEAVVAWLQEDGSNVEQGYTLRIQRVKAK